VNDRVDIKATTSVVREQTIEINLDDLPIEGGINRLVLIVTSRPDGGRPVSRKLVVPEYMLSDSELYGGPRAMR